VATANVVFEGMRPGSRAKLGLGFETLSRANPRIVFACLSGYGATGPDRD
jgi:crotonobetainyl-CoA:carnitine CoA-transferase CaiB-like acyl-CoA transferase